MFFCEECKQENNWPGIVAFSNGKCEMCGNHGGCYDVPSKYLPPPPPPKLEDGVHLSHCCQKHGCKYGHKDCPVVQNGNQEYMCDWCHEDIYVDGGWEDAHLLNEMFDKGRRHAYTEIVKKSQKEGTIRA